MLTTAGHEIPIRVRALFGRTDEPEVIVHGLLESGLALVDRRLFAWRGNGAVGPLPISAIDRILIDTCGQGDRLGVVVLARQAVHPTLVLTRRIQELPSTLAFVAEIARALHLEPRLEEVGDLRRYTFPAVDRG